MADTSVEASIVPVAEVTTAPVMATAEDRPNHRKGVCPIKPEYLRPAEAALSRVSLDADGKTRGMNKGAERNLATASFGTVARPTFEGEMNFLNGDCLKQVKAALRLPLPAEKRGRDEESTAEEHLATAGESESQGKLSRDEVAPASASHMFRDRLFLAPLTTVGNLPFRRVCKHYGADVTLSEMALIYNLNKTEKSEWSLLWRHESENIFGIQVSVSRPADAVKFARAIAQSGFSYDYIDINCGCPVDMIVQSGCGCGLWERKGRLIEVVKALRTYQPKPVTIKCRVGPDEHAPTLHKQIAEYSTWGASAVTIHGRSRKQRYTKLATGELGLYRAVRGAGNSSCDWEWRHPQSPRSCGSQGAMHFCLEFHHRPRCSDQTMNFRGVEDRPGQRYFKLGTVGDAENVLSSRSGSLG